MLYNYVLVCKHTAHLSASIKGGKNNANFYTPHYTANIEEKFAILYKTNMHDKAMSNVLVKVYIKKINAYQVQDGA
jgi:hypothetical protein